MRGPLIVTAELAPRDFAWLDRLRRKHYPAERNRVPAHLTLFRSVPPSAEAELQRLLARTAAESPPPVAQAAGLLQLDEGVAVRIASSELERLRAGLAEDLHGLLSAQDGPGWLPHVTIQNKVEPRQARALVRSLEPGFEPRPIAISGLGLQRYLGGAWEPLRSYPFRGR